MAATVFLIAWPWPARAEWSAVAEQRVSYTTDVFQFSSARRLALNEDPSQPTIVPLGKPSDVVWEPSLEVIKSSSPWLGKNEMSVEAHGFIYTDKPIFNHGDYLIQDRQWLNPDTSVLLRYRYVPNVFLGPNIEHQSGTNSIQEERVTSHHWRLELQRRFNQNWSGTFIGRYGVRLYNEAFAERDTTFYTIGPRADYRPASWITFTLAYLYERGLADGREQPEIKDDVSYYLNLVSFGAEVRFLERLALNLVYLHLRKTFTSEVVGDTHMGRQDLTNQGLAELKYALTHASDATLSFQRTQRSSTDVSRDFNDTIVSLGVQYRF